MSANLNYNVNTNQAGNAEFLAFLTGLSRTDFTPLQEELGKSLRDNVLLRFKDEVDPDGNPWKPSQRAIKQNGQTLSDTTLLKSSLTYAISGDEVEVGTNTPYAGWLQDGTEKMEAREFLGFSFEDEETVEDVITTFMEALL